MIVSWLVYYFRVRKKYRQGKAEWKEKMKDNPDTFCPPWVTELTRDEMEWLHYAHEFYYGPFWYVEDPLGPSQIQSIMFENVRKKVIINIIIAVALVALFVVYKVFVKK